MSKFCIKCGKEIGDKDKHCQYCGADQEIDFGNTFQNSKNSSDHIVPIVAVCSLILVIIIVIANLTIFNNNYEEPIESYFDAIESGDIDDLEDALPEYYLDSDKYDDEKMEKALQISSSALELLGDDYDISYDIIDKDSIDDDKLEELEVKIKRQYDENVDVNKGYKVKLKVTIEFGKLDKDNETTINVYKIDGKWCIINEDISDILF